MNFISEFFDITEKNVKQWIKKNHFNFFMYLDTTQFETTSKKDEIKVLV